MTETTEISLNGNGKANTLFRVDENSNFFLIEKYLSERYDFRYNEVSNELEHRKKNESEYTALKEDNIYRLLKLNNWKVSQADLSAILRSDFVPVHNPLERYFSSLPSVTGTENIDKLCTFIHTENPGDQERFNLHFKKMLVRSIACSLDGVFNKHCLVFIGAQGNGKTTFQRWLVPPRLKNYFTENFSTDKDSLIALSENFFIILDELATLHRSELTTLKSFFTKDKIKVRRPFAKKPEMTIRRANFIGSTNKYEFLSDETGSVRWLCFAIDKIDFTYSSEIKCDSIWAEAYSLYKNKFMYQLSGDELSRNEDVNKEHQILSVEMELIQKHFAPARTESEANCILTASEIMEYLTKDYDRILKNINIISIGKSLKFLGFKQVSVRNEGELPRKKYFLKVVQELTTLSPNGTDLRKVEKTVKNEVVVDVPY